MTCWLGNPDCDGERFASPTSVIRLATLEDAEALHACVVANREYQRPYDPQRERDYFTLDGQRRILGLHLDQFQAGIAAPFLITDAGEVVGRITLSAITRGPVQGAIVGYWVLQDRASRGITTHALHEMVHYAFDELNLHRLEAGTLLDNVRSQRVLEKNGFARFGMAPEYLHINGEWRDHYLFQRVNHAWRG